MTNTCETDNAGHPFGDPQQCISYQQFVAVIRTGNKTELKRLCQLLHDPGPYIRRFLYEHIMTEILDDDIRQVLESVHCNDFLTLLELIRKPELIINLRLDGEKLTKEQCTKLLALDSYINWVRNKSIDITATDYASFENFAWIHITFDNQFIFNKHIEYSEEEASKSRGEFLGLQLTEQQLNNSIWRIEADIIAYIPISDYIEQVFRECNDELKKEGAQVYEGYQIWSDITLPTHDNPREHGYYYDERYDYLVRVLRDEKVVKGYVMRHQLMEMIIMFLHHTRSLLMTAQP